MAEEVKVKASVDIDTKDSVAKLDQQTAALKKNTAALQENEAATKAAADATKLASEKRKAANKEFADIDLRYKAGGKRDPRSALTELTRINGSKAYDEESQLKAAAKLNQILGEQMRLRETMERKTASAEMRAERSRDKALRDTLALQKADQARYDAMTRDRDLGRRSSYTASRGSDPGSYMSSLLTTLSDGGVSSVEKRRAQSELATLMAREASRSDRRDSDTRATSLSQARQSYIRSNRAEHSVLVSAIDKELSGNGLSPRERNGMQEERARVLAAADKAAQAKASSQQAAATAEAKRAESTRVADQKRAEAKRIADEKSAESTRIQQARDRRSTRYTELANTIKNGSPEHAERASRALAHMTGNIMAEQYAGPGDRGHNIQNRDVEDAKRRWTRSGMSSSDDIERTRQRLNRKFASLLGGEGADPYMGGGDPMSQRTNLRKLEQLLQSQQAWADNEEKQMSLQARISRSRSERLRNLGQGMQSLGGTATALALPAIGIGGLAAKSFADEQEAFVRLLRFGQTKEDRNYIKGPLRQGMREMVTKGGIATPIEDAYRIGEEGYLQGVDSKGIVPYAKAVSKFSTITGMKSESAATSMGRIIASTHNADRPESQREDATTKVVKDIQAFSSAMLAADQVTKGHSNDILSLAKNLTAYSGVLKMSFQDTIAISATMVDASIKSEKGATQIGKVLTDFLKIVTTTEKGDPKRTNLMNILGLSDTDEQVGQLKKALGDDALGVLEHFFRRAAGYKQAFKNSSSMDLFHALGIDNQREIQVMSAGLSNSNRGKIRSAVVEGARNPGNLDKQYADVTSDPNHQLQLLKNTLRDIAIDLGQGLIPIIKEVVVAGKPLIDFARDWVDRFGSAGDGTAKLIFQIVALMAVLGPLTSGVGAVIQMISQFTEMRAAAQSAMALEKALSAEQQAAMLLGGTLGKTEQITQGFSAAVNKNIPTFAAWGQAAFGFAKQMLGVAAAIGAVILVVKGLEWEYGELQKAADQAADSETKANEMALRGNIARQMRQINTDRSTMDSAEKALKTPLPGNWADGKQHFSEDPSPSNSIRDTAGKYLSPKEILSFNGDLSKMAAATRKEMDRRLGSRKDAYGRDKSSQAAGEADAAIKAGAQGDSLDPLLAKAVAAVAMRGGSDNLYGLTDAQLKAQGIDAKNARKTGALNDAAKAAPWLFKAIAAEAPKHGGDMRSTMIGLYGDQAGRHIMQAYTSMGGLVSKSMAHSSGDSKDPYAHWNNPIAPPFAKKETEADRKRRVADKFRAAQARYESLAEADEKSIQAEHASAVRQRRQVNPKTVNALMERRFGYLEARDKAKSSVAQIEGVYEGVQANAAQLAGLPANQKRDRLSQWTEAKDRNEKAAQSAANELARVRIEQLAIEKKTLVSQRDELSARLSIADTIENQHALRVQILGKDREVAFNDFKQDKERVLAIMDGKQRQAEYNALGQKYGDPALVKGPKDIGGSVAGQISAELSRANKDIILSKLDERRQTSDAGAWQNRSPEASLSESVLQNSYALDVDDLVRILGGDGGTTLGGIFVDGDGKARLGIDASTLASLQDLRGKGDIPGMVNLLRQALPSDSPLLPVLNQVIASGTGEGIERILSGIKAMPGSTMSPQQRGIAELRLGESRYRKAMYPLDAAIEDRGADADSALDPVAALKATEAQFDAQIAAANLDPKTLRPMEGGDSRQAALLRRRKEVALRGMKIRSGLYSSSQSFDKVSFGDMSAIGGARSGFNSALDAASGSAEDRASAYQGYAGGIFSSMGFRNTMNGGIDQNSAKALFGEAGSVLSSAKGTGDSGLYLGIARQMTEAIQSMMQTDMDRIGRLPESARGGEMGKLTEFVRSIGEWSDLPEGFRKVIEEMLKATDREARMLDPLRAAASRNFDAFRNGVNANTTGFLSGSLQGVLRNAGGGDGTAKGRAERKQSQQQLYKQFWDGLLTEGSNSFVNTLWDGILSKKIGSVFKQLQNNLASIWQQGEGSWMRMVSYSMNALYLSGKAGGKNAKKAKKGATWGAIGGAALGSIIPGVGTAMGASIGANMGGAAGSGGGAGGALAAGLGSYMSFKPQQMGLNNLGAAPGKAMPGGGITNDTGVGKIDSQGRSVSLTNNNTFYVTDPATADYAAGRTQARTERALHSGK